MKLTGKEKMAVSMLRELDAQQRDALLAKIERAAIANRATTRAARKAGQQSKVRTVRDFKIVKAFGATANWRRTRRKEGGA